jgi:hypothetical protein
MLACLPLIALLLLVLICRQRGSGWRGAILSASVIWGTLLTAITEVLSWFSGLNLGWLVVCWGVVCVGGAFTYYRLVQTEPKNAQFEKPFSKTERPKLGVFPIVVLGGVVGIAIAVGVVAVVAPPNTWDSMTYHMSRVANWIQNGNIAHYPTYFLPQLFHPPFAELVILHLQILSGGDYLANLVQWFSMVGCLVGMSLIAQQLGANWQGQILTAVVVVTIPMGILQASSTQNDYAVAFWIVCLAHFVIQSVQDKLTLGNAAKIGASLGLAILTKSSGYTHAFPFLVWLFAAKLPKFRWQLWKPLVTVGAIALALNLNHYLRNIDVFGSPLGTTPSFARHYSIEVYSLPTFISNVVRNLSLHVDIVRYFNLQQFITPTTGLIEKAIRLLHGVLGVDMNDPRITYPAGSYQVPGISFDENVAGNPLHLLLVLVAIALFFSFKHLRNQRLLLTYAGAIVGAFLLLCLLLKIQPYHSRHHLALFILFAAFVGTVFSQVINDRIVNVLAVVILVSCLPWVVNNQFRPMVGTANIFNTPRLEQFFSNREYLIKPYSEAVNLVHGKSCRNVGLWLGTGKTVGDAYWEYPFWLMFQEKNTPVRLQHINTQNLADKKATASPFNQFDPCAIIAVRVKDDPDIGNTTVYQNQTFTRVFLDQPVSVYLKQPS